MENLGELITRTVAQKLDSAFVEKEVERKVAALVSDAVDQALRSYSETGKLIREKVEEALRVQRIDLPTYGSIVAGILKTQIEATVSELVSGRLAQDMEELLRLAPKEVKLSDIAKAMLDQGDHGVEYGDAITVIVGDNSYGSTWVYLDETEHRPERDKYQCRHSLLVRADGTVATATVSGRKIGDAKHIGLSYGIDQMLRAYVACGTKVILDEDFVTIGVGDY
jgi:hypothetical protein